MQYKVFQLLAIIAFVGFVAVEGDSHPRIKVDLQKGTNGPKNPSPNHIHRHKKPTPKPAIKPSGKDDNKKGKKHEGKHENKENKKESKPDKKHENKESKPQKHPVNSNGALQNPVKQTVVVTPGGMINKDDQITPDPDYLANFDEYLQDEINKEPSQLQQPSSELITPDPDYYANRAEYAKAEGSIPKSGIPRPDASISKEISLDEKIPEKIDDKRNPLRLAPPTMIAPNSSPIEKAYLDADHEEIEILSQNKPLRGAFVPPDYVQKAAIFTPSSVKDETSTPAPESVQDTRQTLRPGLPPKAEIPIYEFDGQIPQRAMKMGSPKRMTF